MSNSKLYRIQSNGCPITGFCYRITDPNHIASEVANICKLVDYMCRHNVPHNLFLTFENIAEESHVAPTVLRCFVWPRDKLRANKEVAPMNVAFCELSGYVPVGCKSSAEVERSVHVDLINL